MPGTVVDQPLVDLVGNDHQVVFNGDLGQLLQHTLGQYTASGVAGGDEDHCPGAGGDFGADLVQVDLIAGLLPQQIRDRDCAQ